MRSEEGQTTPLVALLIAAAGGALVLLGHGASAVNDQARAQTAADAGALAGAGGGQRAAEVAVEGNGARLRSFAAHASTVEVVVDLGDRSARARASFGDVR